jgi:hypothetical protein
MIEPENAVESDAQPTGSRSRRRQRVGAAVVITAAVVAALLLLHSCRAASPMPIHAVAVGDMACDPTDPDYAGGVGTDDRCQQKAVSDLALSLDPSLLLGLGDYQYELPSTAAYQDVYGPSWGRLRAITKPALGNQELKVFHANTFRDYFGDLAGPDTGYWSYDIGSWHFVVLNSNCTTVVGGCGAGSPQQLWLEADLQRTASTCVAVTWHHPRFSNGIMGPDQRTKALWDTLVQHDVELVLSAHEHDYERFPRLDSSGRNDVHGPRQFVVGTGGQVHYDPKVGDAPWRQKLTPVASDAQDFTHNGVLALTFSDGGYSWAFHTTAGTVTDSGSDTCH